MEPGNENELLTKKPVTQKELSPEALDKAGASPRRCRVTTRSGY